MTVFVCIINSSYYDEGLSHIDRIYANQDQAEAWKTHIEKEMGENKGILPHRPTSGKDEDLDKFLADSKNLDMAQCFISAEIKPYKVI